MWLYYCLIVWAFICLYGKKDETTVKKVGMIAALIPFWFLCSFRAPEIGNDTSVYMNLFEIAKRYSLVELLSNMGSRFETGFLAYLYMISHIFSNAQWLLIISSTIVFAILGRYLYKYAIDPAFSIFLFVAMRYYFFFMSNVRQAVAMAIILVAYELINNRQYIRSVLLILLAASFHSTAIIFLVAIPMSFLQFKRRYILILGASLLVIILGWNSVVNIALRHTPIYYEMYLTSSYMTNANNLANVLNLLVVSLLGIVIYRSVKSEEGFLELHKEYVYYPLMAVYFSILSLRFSMFARMQYYFSIFLLVMFANSLIINRHAKNGIVIKYVSLVLFVVYFAIIMAYRPEWHNVYPYRFCF